MRKLFSVSMVVLLFVLTACGRKPAPTPSSSVETPPAVENQPSLSPADPLHLPELTVELPRALDAAAAREAMEKLPAAFKKHGVAVDTVSVSFGPTYSATVAALQQGSVQLAFLPAEEFVKLGGTHILLADAPSPLSAPGIYTQICTAPSAYGTMLAELAASQAAPLSWDALNQARWGVLDSSSLTGYRCLRLWLEDNYEDNAVSDLQYVTVYDSWDALLRAAAAEEIDLFPLPPDAAAHYSTRWNSEFGRAGSFTREVSTVGISDGICTWVAAAAPEDAAVNDPQLVQALAEAINSLLDTSAEQAAAIGAEYYAPASDGDLKPLRRMLLSES